jgi:N-acetylmuramoyl-L-alanine amidase
MRDKTISRRRLLVLAGGLLLAGWSGSPANARRRRHHHSSHTARHRRRIVALDPGHGGMDPGAIGPHGTIEKKITLATARDLAHRLAKSGRYSPFLTRRGDVYVPLHRRVALARAHHAELFLSIHANILPDHGMLGLSVYTLSDKASDREAAALAASENRDDFLPRLRRHQPHIAAILRDMRRQRTENLSLRLARAVITELGHEVTLLEKPHRSAGFAVLTAPDIPSVLVELGCLSNPHEEHLLRTRAYQRRLAKGLAGAIDRYFDSPAAA